MTDGVYAPTTAPNPQTPCLVIPKDTWEKVRYGSKVVQVLLSLVAFILEEMVLRCFSCFALYLFEFVSCTAFLFTLLLLVLLITSLQNRVGISCWPKLDFLYTAVIAVTFLVSSAVFAFSHGGSTLEKSAVAFGFFASLMFVVDLGLFYKKGLPFRRNGKEESATTAPDDKQETEKLNEQPSN